MRWWWAFLAARIAFNEVNAGAKGSKGATLYVECAPFCQLVQRCFCTVLSRTLKKSDFLSLSRTCWVVEVVLLATNKTVWSSFFVMLS